MLAKIKNIIVESTVVKKFTSVLSNIFHYIHKKMFWGLFSKIDEKFFKFLFVGALNTLFAYTIYAIFVAIGFRANIALIFQYVIGILWNFKTTGSIVFKNNNNWLIFKFVGAYIFTFCVNSITLKLLTKIFNPYIAQALLVFPIAVLSFLILKFLVFKEKK